MLNKYYFPYHRAFNEMVCRELKRGIKVILVDCHSFSREIIMDESKRINLPDICLGYDESLRYLYFKF